MTAGACRQNEPGAPYAVLRLETVYDFDPTPPSPPSSEGDQSPSSPRTPPPPPGAGDPGTHSTEEPPAVPQEMGERTSSHMSISAAAGGEDSRSEVQGGCGPHGDRPGGPWDAGSECDMTAASALMSGTMEASNAMSHGSETTEEVTMGTPLAKEEEEMLQMVGEGEDEEQGGGGAGGEVDMDRGDGEGSRAGSQPSGGSGEEVQMLSNAATDRPLDSDGTAVTDDHMAVSGDTGPRGRDQDQPPSVLLSEESQLPGELLLQGGHHVGGGDKRNETPGGV